MQLLLDTHLLLWAVDEPERLDAALIQMLEDPLNTPVFSVVMMSGVVAWWCRMMLLGLA